MVADPVVADSKDGRGMWKFSHLMLDFHPLG
jgi:hypothetical protein